MKVQIYKDRKGQWRWPLRARNGRIMADSGEGYARQANAERAFDRVTGSIQWCWWDGIPEKQEQRR